MHNHKGKNNNQEDPDLSSASENLTPQDVQKPKKGSSDQVVLSLKEYEELSEKVRKADEYWDKLLRQQADYENSRKRMERERIDFQRYAQEDLIIDLLGILDDLERSVEAAEGGQENYAAFLKGIEMILSHLYDLLKKKGVSPIEAKGRKFDPHLHEALMQKVAKGVAEGIVLEEMQKGYKLNDRVIRTAKVCVAKDGQDAVDAEANGTVEV